MGQASSKQDHVPLNTPELQQGPISKQTQSIINVLDPHGESHFSRHRQHYEKEREKPGLFLLPVMSNESSFSENTSFSKASSVTKNFTLVESGAVNQVEEDNFSPLLSLPIEILYQIIEIVYYDESTSSIPANLEKFLKTIPVLLKTFNQLAIRFLYKYAIFTRPQSFDRFLMNILNQPDIGQCVEFMDFQTFTSIGLGRTGRMNQEIQMVTSATIQLALQLCPNLTEFLASENIQDDMDVNVLLVLFNHLPKIQAMDFCGASLSAFAMAFNELQIEPDESGETDSQTETSSMMSTRHEHLSHLFKISFHDCSNLAPSVFEKLLPHFTHLRRLDLTHTSITSSILLAHMPHSCRLTHLSLARCSKLTTKDLINFLVGHPAVALESLEWLNLQIDSNVVSPLSDVYLLYTLNHLKAPGLKYLNLGGLPVNGRILQLIKNKFTNLESLTISHSSVNMNDLEMFMQDNTTIKFLDLSSIKCLDRWKLTNFLKTCYGSNLEGLEFDYKTLYNLTAGNYVRIDAVQTDFRITETPHLPQVWKFYDNEGRRAWLYRIDTNDPQYDSIISGSSKYTETVSNLVYYDLETGAKIETKSVKPSFLKYASRKVNCSIGYYNLNNTKKKRYIENNLHELVWPVEFSQRGIYNYYSLNVK